jgi:hypothetical protein
MTGKLLINYTMENKNVFDFLEQEAYYASIDKLIWIAAQYQSSEFHDIMTEFEDYEELFPFLDDEDFDSDDRHCESIVEKLFDNNKIGFLAVIYIPIPEDITFKTDGSISSYSSSMGYCCSACVYGDTLDELMTNVKNKSKALFDPYIANARKKLSK